ncbi:MAG: YhbY family RNA-binding protein [Oscillospiraceae bacterium]|nr:YhbY family RNA-binding protein [Oscillospiraceae bacterium]
MLTSKQRAFLRSQARMMPPIFQIGKEGIGENSVKALSDALDARELIKIHVLENSMYTAREAREELCGELGCESVQVIGSKIVIFRQKKKDSKYDLRKLELNY